MDTTTRKLLVELARTVLRVLDESAQDGSAKIRPDLGGTTEKPTAISILPAMVAAMPSPSAGMAVRVWTGDRYEVGQIESVCRGEPRRVWVRVSRGEGRRVKRVRVEWNRCQQVGGAK